LIGLGAWIYFKVLLPRKEFEPYSEALRLLNEKRYETALPLLTKMEGKLPEGVRREARYFIAFAYHQLNNSTEAQRWLDALYVEDSSDANVAYLLAHIRVAEERYDEAEPVLEKMERNRQLSTHHARKLLGVVKFRRAVAALKEKRIDVAASLFGKVQELGDFADQIPADLRNRHIALGTEALFNKDAALAREKFASLEKAAASAPEEQRQGLLATAKLGLALVKWIEEDSDPRAAVESMLVEAARLFDPDGPVELPWPEEETGKDVLERLSLLDAVDGLASEQKDLNRCLRDIHFLRGMAVLKSWSLMDGAKAHDEIQTQFEAALNRFACARSRDDEFSDVPLVVGLLMYYLYKPGPQRGRAVDLLEQSRKLGMHDPDALEIVNNRQRIERANANAVDKYLQVLDQYVNDDTVRREVRSSLLERLSKYKRIQDWGGSRPPVSQSRNVEPTVAEVRHRSELLLVRVGQILSARGDSAEGSHMQALSQNILRESEGLLAQVAAIEEQESELLVLTGTHLLKEQ
jgi:tetratricopeptide (TPR) repeat protein